MKLVVGEEYILTGEAFDPLTLAQNNHTFIYVGIDPNDDMDEFIGVETKRPQWAFRSFVNGKDPEFVTVKKK